MEKDFDTWNTLKKQLHAGKVKKFFHEREVWWCSLGLNIGFEQDGKNELFERPVLIIKKFNLDIAWVLPLTSSDKNTKYYFPISSGKENSKVILSQLKLLSSKRLLRRMYKLPSNQFEQITNTLKVFLLE